MKGGEKMVEKESRIFLRVDDDDKKTINIINHNHLKAFEPFTHGSYAGVHTWCFDSPEMAEKARVDYVKCHTQLGAAKERLSMLEPGHTCSC